ncbi:hypothetical protein Ddye_012870 [Dipteronia dyeriana]|uniref:AAA+ ATPase domain-containing protein n=1 Tax=Dipteronia dyeriana TaxID=168575 RepID=A0AAD9X557_9ROSI|nr:hypothetical protein Ddye_012870 [Dipteronia dyeriana]
MGRRSGGGGGSNTEILRRRVESCKIKHSNLGGVVDYLRDNYPDYRRTKEKPFIRMVQQTLDRINKSNSTPSPGKKNFRRRVDDDVEERLQSLEKQHVKRRRPNDSSTEEEGESSSSSSSSEEEEEEEDEEEDGGLSTSEDAIYGEDVEPEFDLMKSMLRDKYSESKSGKPKGEEKNVEFEVGSGRKLEMVNGDNRGRNVDTRKESAKKGSVGDVVDAKGKGGPRFRDLGGMGGVLKELKMEVIVPLYHPQLPQWLGVRPMAGILLYGPPGCGKTKLAHAIANETGVPFYKISAPEVVSGVSGASEENIRELFSKAYRTAPSIVFIDEIDAIASKRENLQREMEKRIVTQLMTCMDESHRFVQSNDGDSNSEASNQRPGYVLVIGATNRPDAVDPALRRPGRFDREIVLGVPDENARVEILSVIIRNLRVEGSFDLLKIARSTPGFVGADLSALANKAGNLAMKRIIDQRKSEFSGESMAEEHSDEWWRQPWLPEEMENLAITMADFEEASKMVQPAARREGFSAIPNVKWEDVGGLDYLRQEFERYIVRRIKFPEEYEELGIDLETGFLLYGPPGCGKTLIAKAVANEAGANFIHIKGPELLNKYVGESELAVRTLFSRARTCSPCILFFDEVDALTTKRGKEGGWVVERLLNQLLIELDGADQRRGVFVIGATNRPDVMDRAVLRPGRFGKLLYVPLPTADERGLILKALARNKRIDANVDLCAVAQMKACESLSGADLSALMNEATMAAWEENLTATESCSWTIKITHFERALSKITPSVSNQQRQRYQNLSENLKAA